MTDNLYFCSKFYIRAYIPGVKAVSYIYVTKDINAQALKLSFYYLDLLAVPQMNFLLN